ncbi:hypothetical protein [Sphaerotilus microaerophilus]|uniref:hypothetical protein n=1 Tax=Sphaerotilus microaerophilus TaxID=2914710 RepID=UPI0020736A3C|nr:hypothetical protein [Sphaerotilus sp. FB-5]
MRFLPSSAFQAVQRLGDQAVPAGGQGEGGRVAALAPLFGASAFTAVLPERKCKPALVEGGLRLAGQGDLGRQDAAADALHRLGVGLHGLHQLGDVAVQPLRRVPGGLTRCAALRVALACPGGQQQRAHLGAEGDDMRRVDALAGEAGWMGVHGGLWWTVTSLCLDGLTR